MKKTIALLSFILLFSLCSTAYAGDGLQQFYARHRADDNTESIKLSRFLLALVPKDKETRALLRFLKSIRIFHIEAPEDRRSTLVGELQGALVSDRFESLMEVTDNQDRVHIYINQDAKKIRHMLIMVDSDKELVVLQARTNITFDQLNELLHDGKPGNTGLKKLVNIKG